MENPLLAYENVPFLESDACRTIRLQLEFLHPEVQMEESNILSTVVLFGSARIPSPENADPSGKGASSLTPYYEEARKLASMISRRFQTPDKREFVVVTGGGGGIMEAGNRGAKEVGSKSVALNIELPFEQHPNAYVDEELCFNFHYFNMRKMHFLHRAKAVCIFPGGMGTFDELFEAVTLIQTKKIEPMPVILFGTEHWKRMIDWDYMAECGMICPEDLELLTFCDRAEDAMKVIEDFYEA